MQYASKIDFAALMEPVAALLLGEPNARLSKPPRDVRYGTHGSLSVDFESGRFFDHEASVGGGVIDLITHKTGRDQGRHQRPVHGPRHSPARLVTANRSGARSARPRFARRAWLRRGGTVGCWRAWRSTHGYLRGQSEGAEMSK